MYLEKVSIFFFFLYLNFIPGLMSMTFFFLKVLGHSSSPLLLELEDWLLSQNLLQTNTLRELKLYPLGIMTVFSVLRMKTNWILPFFFFFFLYKFSVIATGWENCDLAWQILCWPEGITPLFLRRNYVCVMTHLRQGWLAFLVREIT